MSIRVSERRGKTTVETDYKDSFGSDHSRAYQDSEMLGLMRSAGIEKVEVSGIGDRTNVTHALHEEFDRQYESITGRKHFGW